MRLLLFGLYGLFYRPWWPVHFDLFSNIRDAGSQVRTADQIYDYVWFIGGLAVGVLYLMIAALLSDKLKKVPQ